MKNHFFGEDKKRAAIVLTLFLTGIIVFLVNNAIPFFVNDEKNYLIPRLIMRFITSLSWFIAVCIGTVRNKNKRNHLLIPALFFYIPGDIFAIIYLPFSALFYVIGHFFLIRAIMETTYIKRYQYGAFVFGILLSIAVFLLYFKKLTLVCVIGILYGTVCSWVMAASLSNRFYSLAGLIFFISDLAGFARIALMDTKPVYLVTTFIYYLAIFLLCLSVFNESKKEVVTWGDLKNVLLSAAKEELKIYLAGRWGMNLVLGHKKFFYERLEMAYCLDDKEKLLHWLNTCAYSVEEEFPDGVLKCYSEKYGNLYAIPFYKKEDGDEEMILVTAKHKSLILDNGFFTRAPAFGKDIPCLVPGADILA